MKEWSGLAKFYLVVGSVLATGYAATQFIGWEPGSASEEFVPMDVRSTPGGYRTFHYWHRGYRGGK